MIDKTVLSPFKNLRMAVLIAAALAVLGSANSVLNGFVYDDRPIIELNEKIQSWETLPEALVEPYWPNEYGQDLGLWRPVVTGVYGVVWNLFGENPVPFHTVLVLLHAIATGLVVVFLAELMPLSAAFVGGLIFAVHPVHTEAVANIVGTAEVLPTIFYVLACLVFLRSSAGDRRVGVGPTLLITVCFALAFLSKESAVTLPGVLFLLDGVRRRSRTLADVPDMLRRQWGVYAAIVATVVVVFVARVEILGTVANPMPPLGVEIIANEAPRLYTVTQAWAHYFRLLFFPMDLSADYSPGVIPVTYGWNAVNLLGIGMALLALGASFAAWRRGPMGPDESVPRGAAFAVMWFVITISPISNIVFLSGVVLAERTLYLPSVGFAAGAGWLLYELWKERPRVAVVAVTAVVLAMGIRTYNRNTDWVDNLTLFNSILRDHPESGRAQWLLADGALMMGNEELTLDAYQAALGILNGTYPLLIDIGRTLLRTGREDAAEHILLRAWEDRPDRGIAPQVLSVIYYNSQRYDQAIAAAEHAVAYYEGTDPVSSHMLAMSLAAQGRWEESIEARIMTIEDAEQRVWQQWYWLGEAYANAGRSTEAAAAFDSAMARNDDPAGQRLIDSMRVVIGAR